MRVLTVGEVSHPVRTSRSPLPTSPAGPLERGREIPHRRERIPQKVGDGPAKLSTVISQPSPSEPTRRLTDLRRAQPTDATLRNLLGVLTAKLELCASLPVYEWEAGSEGHEDCAAAFRSLAEAERQSCNDVLNRLREHLELRAAGLRGQS
jgi:hypothetical protein